MSLLQRVRKWFKRKPAKEDVSDFSGFGLVPDPGLANWNWFRQWAGIFQLVDRMARARGGNLVEIPLDDRMVYIARGLMRYNTYAQGMINALRMHTLGTKGFKYHVTGPSAEAVKRFLDFTHKKLQWWWWEREIYQRVHVEGNSISRFFPQDDWIDVRPIEPEWIIPKDGTEEWTYGFYNEPGDVQDVTALHTLYGTVNEVVDGNEWYHVKAKLAMRVDKRGASDFLPAASLLDDSFKTWRNFAGSEAVRASIIYFTKHPEGVTPDDVAQNIAAESDYGPPTQPPGVPQQPPLKLQWGGAGVEHLGNGQDLAAPPQFNAQTTLTGVNATLLAAGRAYHIPLVLMSGDMSANNTLDFSDDSPFGMTIQDEQRWFSEHMKQLNWRMVETAAWNGILPMRVLSDGTELEVHAERKQARNVLENTNRAKTLEDDGIISRRERSTMEGVDYDEQQAQRRRESQRAVKSMSAGEEATQQVTVHRGGKTFKQKRKKAEKTAASSDEPAGAAGEKKTDPETGIDTTNVPKSKLAKVKAAFKEVALRVNILIDKLSPAGRKVAAVLAEVFDTPEDMKRFAYNPTTSGGVASHANNDFVSMNLQDTFGVGISGHLVAAVAARALVKGFAAIKKKLGGSKAATEEAGDGVDEVAAMVARVFRDTLRALKLKGRVPPASEIEARLRQLIKEHNSDAQESVDSSGHEHDPHTGQFGKGHGSRSGKDKPAEAGGVKAVKKLVKKEKDATARDYLEAALENADADDEADVAQQLASMYVRAHEAGHEEAVGALAEALHHVGAEQHGVEPGESADYSGKYYESQSGVGPGDDVEVVRQPVVSADGKVLAKGTVKAR